MRIHTCIQTHVKSNGIQNGGKGFSVCVCVYRSVIILHWSQLVPQKSRVQTLKAATTIRAETTERHGVLGMGRLELEAALPMPAG